MASDNSLFSSLRDQFKAFSQFGDTKSDGTTISLSQSDKWLKQANVIDGKSITTTDTGIHFKKFKSLKIGWNDYKRYLEDLGKTKKVDLSVIEQKLLGCGAPGVPVIKTSAKADASVSRLTDTSQYTGAHKQRFDDSGKGRGAEGRSDKREDSGYVSGYQNKDTFDKTH